MASVTALTAERRPAAHAEGEIVSLILSGDLPPGANLPSERTLSLQLGVTRPTLREALQRLDRDGWIEVRHGKSTRVKDIWAEGGLNVLAGVVRYGGNLPPRFVSNLLQVRVALAPIYARAAVDENPKLIVETLAAPLRPADDADAFAEFDWKLHLALTRASENPVFTLILNGFSNLYPAMAVHYFAAPAARRASRQFYDALEQAARTKNLAKAEKVTREAMQDSLERWLDVEKKLRAAFANPGDDR